MIKQINLYSVSKFSVYCNDILNTQYYADEVLFLYFSELKIISHNSHLCPTPCRATKVSILIL